MNGSTSEDRKYIVTSRIPGRKDLSSSEAVPVGNTLYLGAHNGLDQKHGAASEPRCESPTFTASLMIAGQLPRSDASDVSGLDRVDLAASYLAVLRQPLVKGIADDDLAGTGQGQKS
jgi:hypothetical protein